MKQMKNKVREEEFIGRSGKIIQVIIDFKGSTNLLTPGDFSQ